MKLLFLICAICGILLTLSACTNVTVGEYINNTPKLVPEKFFQGQLAAHGVVKNRSGKVIRYFNATINAHWENNIGTLEEKFIFNDGEIQFRTWKLNPVKSDNKDAIYSATAGDVIGLAQGKAAGNAFNLQYVLNIQYKGSPTEVTVNDWMWLVDDKTILNESSISKFGFNVGSIQLTITKTE